MRYAKTQSHNGSHLLTNNHVKPLNLYSFVFVCSVKHYAKTLIFNHSFWIIVANSVFPFNSNPIPTERVWIYLRGTMTVCRLAGIRGHLSLFPLLGLMTSAKSRGHCYLTTRHPKGIIKQTCVTLLPLA